MPPIATDRLTQTDKSVDRQADRHEASYAPNPGARKYKIGYERREELGRSLL